MFLDERAPLRMGDIASHLGITLTATTIIVDRLVKKEMLKRASDPHDRRVVLCELTDGGRRVLERYNLIIRDRLLLVADSWDLDRLETVV